MSEQAKKQFYIQRVYTKDLSFESPNSPQLFTQEWKPEVSVSLDNRIRDLGEGVYEVVVYISVEAKQDAKSAFMVEVQQAGVFLAQGFEAQELEPLLNIAAPNILFPYARETISDLVTRGSFPQFLLAPVNFESIYQERLQRAAAQEGQGAQESTTTH